MQDVHVLRHQVLVEERSRRQVAREPGISRNTVRRHLERRNVSGMNGDRGGRSSIPLAAIGARWKRPGAMRIRAIRDTWAAPYLPLLMVGSFVGLLAYLVWSSHYAPAGVGPDGFPLSRWLDTALTATFAIVWLPLFPRVTAILTGVIAGIVVFALFGYILLESSLSHGDGCALGPLLYSSLAMLIGFSLLSCIGWLKLTPVCGALALTGAASDITGTEAVVAIFLVFSALLALFSLRRSPMTAHPLACAVVSSSMAIGLCVIGGDFGFSCGSPLGLS